MKTIRVQVIAILAAVLFSFQAYAGNQDQLGGYDFGYEASGDVRAKPLQVFDNGVSTYFQFREGDPVPLIMAMGPQNYIRLHPEIDGPYVRVGGIAKDYVLKLGKSTVKVRYTGSRAIPVASVAKPDGSTGGAYAQLVMPGDAPLDARSDQTKNRRGPVRNIQDDVLPRIAVDVNSYAVPIRGDVAQFQPMGVEPIVTSGGANLNPIRGINQSTTANVKDIPFVEGVASMGPIAKRTIKSIAGSFRPGNTVTVIGHYDSSFKENLAIDRANAIVAQLAREGVPSAVIRVEKREALGDLVGKHVVGAKVILNSGSGSASAIQQQGFVSAQAVTEATLASLEQRLKAKRLTPSQAASSIAELRSVAQPRYVQPIAGWQEAQITRWQMRATDLTVHGVLQRWASESGWHLIWKDAPEIKVLADSDYITRDGFVAAADYVLAQAQSMGYQIKGRPYRNRVIVISAN